MNTRIPAIELSVLAGQCLDRRIATKEDLAREVAAWEAARNAAAVTIDWRFTTDDARITLKHLYPILVKKGVPADTTSTASVTIAS
jgi:hypothetical protein